MIITKILEMQIQNLQEYWRMRFAIEGKPVGNKQRGTSKRWKYRFFQSESREIQHKQSTEPAYIRISQYVVTKIVV